MLRKAIAQGVALGDSIQRLILARQQDHVIGEIEADFIKRKIREGDVSAVNHVVVAVAANESGGMIWLDCQRPELKVFMSNAWFALAEGNRVDQPICSTVFGHILRPFGVKDIAG